MQIARNLSRHTYRKLVEAGYALRSLPGAAMLECDGPDAAVQAILADDVLPDVRRDRIAEIRAEGLARVQAIFPAIRDLDDLDLIVEQWRSIAPAARQPTTKWAAMLAVRQAAQDGIAAVRAAGTIAAVEAVTVAWP